MYIAERQAKIIEYIHEKPTITVSELAKKLFVSEPTIRRDFTELSDKGYITKIYGGAILNQPAADGEIPFSIREKEGSKDKIVMGEKAVSYIKDGMVLMLDGSTSSYYLVPYLERFKDLIVITSGAKTALALAERNIRSFCTGGQMVTHSFSYVGEQAEKFVRSLNADLLFFSCRGLADDGKMTEKSIEEANLRKTMFESAGKKILLCDSSKFNQKYFYNMGTLAEIDDLISEIDTPQGFEKMLKKNREGDRK